MHEPSDFWATRDWHATAELMVAGGLLLLSALAWRKRDKKQEAAAGVHSSDNRAIATSACSSQIGSTLVVATITIGVCGVLATVDGGLPASAKPHLERSILYALISTAASLWASAHLSRLSAVSNPSFEPKISLPNFAALLLLGMSIERVGFAFFAFTAS